MRSEVSGQIPAMTGMRHGAIRSRKPASSAGSNTGWVTANSAPASTFQWNRSSSRSRSMRALVGRHADHEPGRLADRGAAGIESLVQPAHHVGESDAVDVEDRGGVGVGPGGRRIAGHDEHVPKAAGGRPQQVAQHAEHVSVAAGVVEHRLQSDLALHQQRGGHDPHAALRARPVHQVDRVHSRLAKGTALLQHARRVPAARGHDLHASDERPVGELPRPLRARRERHRLRARRFGRRGQPVLPRITRRGRASATHSLIRRMCSGVVPQQPPMNRAPAAVSRRAYWAM